MARASASPLLEDDLGFRFTLHADGIAPAFGFRDGALLFGLRQCLDAPPFDFGGLQNGGDQFAFAAQNFGVLHLDFLFFLDLADLDSLCRSPAAA